MLCKNSAVSRKRNKKLSFSSFRGQQFWQQLIIMILNLLTYLSFYWLYIEAVIRGVLLKKVFLEISQNSQENSCARVSFLIKLQALGLQLYLKRDPGTGVFLWILRKFLRTPFLTEHLWWLLLYRLRNYDLAPTLCQLCKERHVWPIHSHIVIFPQPCLRAVEKFINRMTFVWHTEPIL